MYDIWLESAILCEVLSSLFISIKMYDIWLESDGLLLCELLSSLFISIRTRNMWLEIVSICKILRVSTVPVYKYLSLCR